MHTPVSCHVYYVQAEAQRHALQVDSLKVCFCMLQLCAVLVLSYQPAYFGALLEPFHMYCRLTTCTNVWPVQEEAHRQTLMVGSLKV